VSVIVKPQSGDRVFAMLVMLSVDPLTAENTEIDSVTPRDITADTDSPLHHDVSTDTTPGLSGCRRVLNVETIGSETV